MNDDFVPALIIGGALVICAFAWFARPRAPKRERLDGWTPRNLRHEGDVFHEQIDREARARTEKG